MPAFFAAALAFVSTAAQAQWAAAPSPVRPTVVAVPPLPTPDNVKTSAGETASIGNGISEVITADLKSTGRFIPADTAGVRMPSYPEVTAPAYPIWRGTNAEILLSGFVEARADERLMVGCYVYDVRKERELTRKGFLVPAAEWRRAAHKCADLAYTKVTGNGPLFDSRIAYVAQSGSIMAPVKKLAVMDADGTNHAYLTAGNSTVLSPRWSPDGKSIAYTAMRDGELRVEIVGSDGSGAHPLLPGGISFAPAFAPDGQRLAISIATQGNTDIFSVAADGSRLKRLTTSPAIDTGASYSPDGGQIVFASDRSGSQQLYVMNADGTGQRRISFGGGDYGSPAWSPDGNRIAFSKNVGGAVRVGVMNVNGSDERILTNGVDDDGPAWSPSSGQLLFDRSLPGTGRDNLYSVSIDTGVARPVQTPQSGSDPYLVARQ
jgi:TolB protein